MKWIKTFESYHDLIVWRAGEIKSGYPIFFTKDLSLAKIFKKEFNYDVIYGAKLHLKNPFIMESSGSWENLHIDEILKTLSKEDLFEMIQYEFGGEYTDLDDYLNNFEPISADILANYLMRIKKEYDGLILKDIDETGNFINTDDYIVFDTSKIEIVKTIK
jgi:hypothetical protein